MRSQLSRAHLSALKASRCQIQTTLKRAFAHRARLRNTTPHYEPPSPKDSKGNDARLSRFSKLLGVGVGVAIAFGYSIYKHNKSKSSPNGSSAATTADGFAKYRLASRQDISSTSAIFTLRPLLGSAGLNTESNTRAIQSVQLKQPQLQIARAYTLLPPELGQAPDELRLLIRREKGGEVSGYLHRLESGAEIEVRGPSVEYELPEKLNKVVFLAGGTGIAPALQIARHVRGEADLHILWASRRREDCEGGVSDTVSDGQGWAGMVKGWFGKEVVVAEEGGVKSEIVRRLEEVKREGQGRVAVDYFVDEEERAITPAEATTLVRGAFSMEEKSEGKNVMFVSGPEGFVRLWAGPKQWRDGRELQGPLGGVLAKLNLKDWEIVKL
jgi:hypothetical protein